MKRFVLAAATAATMLTSAGAFAGPVQYAAFREWSDSAPTIAFDNNTGGSGGTLHSIDYDGNTPYSLVDFSYLLGGLPPVLTGYQFAHMTFSATTNSAATLVDFTGNGPTIGDLVIQSFQSGMIKFTRDTSAGVGANNGDNLLTLSFTNLQLTGTYGGGSASTITTTPSSVMLLTSDFFDFTTVNAQDFSLSLSAVIPSLQLAANNSISSFTAHSSGTFASDPAPTYVPEPAMLGLFGAGAFGLAFARRRKS